MFQHILYEVKDNIATLTLNRPNSYNAFIDDMNYEVQKALKLATKDDEVRVVIITGAGKAFCSGQDLKNIQGAIGERNLGESVRKRYNPMVKLMIAMPKPIICQLNGVAAGAGCSLALASDITIASEQASLINVFVNVGLVLDSGGSYFLPRLVGMKKAFELATLATKVSAKEALTLGLVNQVVAHEELSKTVNQLAKHYAKAPTKAIGLIKKMLHKTSHSDLSTALEYEAQCQEIAGYTHDHKEGVLSFVEKRKPSFKGC